MTQAQLIKTLRNISFDHVQAHNGNLGLVLGDLLIYLPTIIADYRDNGDEYYIGIRPFGFECSTNRDSLMDILSCFTKQNMLVYRISIRKSENCIFYDIEHLTTYITR